MHDDSTQTMTLYWLSSVVPHRWKILDFSWPAISQEFSFLWGYSRQQPLWTTAMHVYHQKTRAPCHVWIVTYDHKTLHDWKISTNFFRNIEKKFQIFLVQVFFQQNKMQIFRLQNNFGWKFAAFVSEGSNCQRRCPPGDTKKMIQHLLAILLCWWTSTYYQCDNTFQSNN